MVTGLGKTTMFYQALFERETSMLAANRLTQIGNERMSGDCLLPALAQRIAAQSVCLTLDCVQFSKTDCAAIRFNLDNGNKTSP